MRKILILCGLKNNKIMTKQFNIFEHMYIFNHKLIFNGIVILAE